MGEILRTHTNPFEAHPCGLVLPKRKRPTAIDLFSGCGGMSLGFIQAGYEVVAAVDWDCPSMETYCVNLGSHPLEMHFISPDDEKRMEKHLRRYAKGLQTMSASGIGWIKRHPEAAPVRHVWLGDVRLLKGHDILDAIGMQPGEVDVVMGGPPCQGFSIARKRDVMDPRNSLVFDFVRLVLEIKPKIMVLENVPGIRSMVTPEGFGVLDSICRVLADGGFGPFDALKRALLATSGAGAAWAGHESEAKPDEPREEQMTLLG